MPALVKLPDISTHQHKLLMDSIETRINYLKDEVKMGDLEYIETRKTREEIKELMALMEGLA